MKVVALTDFAHNAEHVEQGQELELGDRDAVHLIGLGRVKKVAPKAADAQAETADESAPETADATPVKAGSRKRA